MVSAVSRAAVSRLLDPAGGYTSCADVHPLGRTADLDPYPLNVGFEFALGVPRRFSSDAAFLLGDTTAGDDTAGCDSLTAYLTSAGHVFLLYCLTKHGACYLISRVMSTKQ